MKTLDFSNMANRWPSDYVSRERISDFTGGLIHPRTMANLDCLGEGPAEKIRLGKKIAYPVPVLIQWLNKRISDV